MKVDQDGNFCPFPGITVIAPIAKTHQTIWQELHDNIKNTPEINQYFAAIPHASYHMTTRNLVTQEDVPDLDEYIETNQIKLSTLNQRLHDNTFNPNVQINGILTNGAIQLALNFLNPQQQNTVMTVASGLRLDGWIPETFHITLAYQYKSIPKSKKEDIVGLIADKINQALVKLDNYTLELSPPNLVYFKDMTAYYPWNGKTNPFKPCANNEVIMKQSPTSFDKAIDNQLGKLESSSLDDLPIFWGDLHLTGVIKSTSTEASFKNSPRNSLTSFFGINRSSSASPGIQLTATAKGRVSPFSP